MYVHGLNVWKKEVDSVYQTCRSVLPWDLILYKLRNFVHDVAFGHRDYNSVGENKRYVQHLYLFPK